MNTNETTIAAPAAAKKKRKLKRYIVTLNGVPCGRVCDKKKFGVKLVPAGGTLVQKPDSPDLFPGEKSAHQAIRRAQRLRKRLTEAVCVVGPAYAEFTRSGEFKIELHSTV